MNADVFLNRCRGVIRSVSAYAAVVGILFGTISPAAASCLWQTGQLPKSKLFLSVEPESIRAFSSSDIWAANNADRTLLHWDGAKWSVVAIPVNTPPNTALVARAVTGTSDNDLWVDAMFLSQSDQYAKSLHFDGSRWTVARMPSGYPLNQICPGQGDGPNISSMQSFGLNDVWAAGIVCHVVSGKDIFVGVSEHWDGVRWKITLLADSLHVLPFGLPSEMSGTSDHDIWLLGEQSVIEHFDGQRWSISSKYGVFNALMEGVFAGAADDAWVVGFIPKTGNPGSEPRSFAAHWNGIEWLQIPTPNVDGQSAQHSNDLHAVSGSAPNDVWAVGENDRHSSPPHGAIRLEVMHWDGSTWSNESMEQLGLGGFFSAVDLGHHDVWALGSDNPDIGNGNPIGSFRCSGVLRLP
jgi:hypothetical protein